MYRDTNCSDTCIDTLGAVLQYFLNIEQQQILFMLNLKSFNLFTISNYITLRIEPFKNQFAVTSRMQRDGIVQILILTIYMHH